MITATENIKPPTYKVLEQFRCPPMPRPFYSFSARDWLKQKVDELTDEEVKLLTYHLRLEEIEKEIAAMEKEVEEYNKKREEQKNGQRQAD